MVQSVIGRASSLDHRSVVSTSTLRISSSLSQVLLLDFDGEAPVARVRRETSGVGIARARPR